MQFKKIFVLIILAVLFANSAAAQNKSRLHKILEAGVLRVGTTGDWNPMTVRDPTTNNYKGFDIDVMNELAKDMGVKLKFVPTEWKTLINGIMADKDDIAASASVTPQRIRTVGFTKSYYQVTTVPLTLKKNLAPFKDWEDIDKPSVTVAVILGTSQEQQVKNVFSPINHRFAEADPQGQRTHRDCLPAVRNLHGFGFRILDSYPDCFMDGTQVGVYTGRQSSDRTPLVTGLWPISCS